MVARMYFAGGSDDTRSCVYIRRSGLSCVMRGRSLVVQYVTRNMILWWKRGYIAACWYGSIWFISLGELLCLMFSSYWWRRLLRSIWKGTHSRSEGMRYAQRLFPCAWALGRCRYSRRCMSVVVGCWRSICSCGFYYHGCTLVVRRSCPHRRSRPSLCL